MKKSSIMALMFLILLASTFQMPAASRDVYVEVEDDTYKIGYGVVVVTKNISDRVMSGRIEYYIYWIDPETNQRVRVYEKADYVPGLNPGESERFIWDQKDNQGRQVKPGRYEVTVRFSGEEWEDWFEIIGPYAEITWFSPPALLYIGRTNEMRVKVKNYTYGWENEILRLDLTITLGGYQSRIASIPLSFTSFLEEKEYTIPIPVPSGITPGTARLLLELYWERFDEKIVFDSKSFYSNVASPPSVEMEITKPDTAFLGDQVKFEVLLRNTGTEQVQATLKVIAEGFLPEELEKAVEISPGTEMVEILLVPQEVGDKKVKFELYLDGSKLEEKEETITVYEKESEIELLGFEIPQNASLNSQFEVKVKLRNSGDREESVRVKIVADWADGNKEISTVIPAGGEKEISFTLVPTKKGSKEIALEIYRGSSKILGDSRKIEIITGKPKVVLEKRVSKPIVKTGEVIEVTVEFRNEGSGIAKNLVITDKPPARATIVGGDLTWTGDLAPGETGTLRYSIQFSYSGVYSLTPAEAKYEDEEGNEEKTISNSVSVEVKEKEGEKGKGIPGFTYHQTVLVLLVMVMMLWRRLRG